MTNTGGTPAGWYHAAGDPDGTHRYWDGSQWIGDPQPVPQAPEPAATSTPPPAEDSTVQYSPPTPGGAGGGGFAPPEAAPSSSGFGSPGTGGAPPNSPPGAFAPPGASSGAAPSAAPGTYAEWGPRAIALLIDWAIGVGIAVVGGIVVAIGFAIADALGVLLAVVAAVAYLAYFIWNFCIRQGTTGQTIGKEKQGIKLVKDDTAQPVGPGMAFVRYLIVGVLGGLCGIYPLVDYLWPLWDEDNKRITDKIVTMSVVTV